MAQIQTNPLIVPFLFLTIFSSFYFTRTQQNGFSLELIHRNSPKSPFYPGDLTDSERLNMLLRLSKQRASKLDKLDSCPNETITSKTVRFGVSEDDLLYLVKIHLGTPGTPFFLLMDTGSALTWTQCQPLTHSFPQNPPIFSGRSSSTYHQLPCQHPFCRTNTPDIFRCVSDNCMYTLRYANNASTTGVAAMDVITTYDGRHLNAYFGCSHDNKLFVFGHSGRTAGIMGLNLSPVTVLRQWIDMTLGQFSYCLVPYHSTGISVTLLRFGNTIPIHGRNFQSIRVAPVDRRRNNYYVNLLDISVGSRAMRFPRDTFARKSTGGGGCIIDSGTSTTFVARDAYDRLVPEFESHFDRLGLVRYRHSEIELDLCYRLQGSARFQDYPSLTYHFEGANFTVQPRYLYILVRDHGALCLVLTTTLRKTIIGALHQANTRFVYEADPHHPRILFSPENCLNDRI